MSFSIGFEHNCVKGVLGGIRPISWGFCNFFGANDWLLTDLIVCQISRKRVNYWVCYEQDSNFVGVSGVLPLKPKQIAQICAQNAQICALKTQDSDICILGFQMVSLMELSKVTEGVFF